MSYNTISSFNGTWTHNHKYITNNFTQVDHNHKHYTHDGKIINKLTNTHTTHTTHNPCAYYVYNQRDVNTTNNTLQQQ